MADFMYDLVAIVCAPSGKQEYIDELRELWRTISDHAVPDFTPQRVTYGADGRPKIPWMQASELMFQQMKIFKQVNHG